MRQPAAQARVRLQARSASKGLTPVHPCLRCGLSFPALRVKGDAMSEPTTDFAALLARARQGETQALEELTRRYEPEVRMLARVRLGPALRPYLDSVDVVQSVHKSLLSGLRQDQFDISSPEKLVALALEMVRRKLGKHWRRERRQQRPGPMDAEDLARLLTDLPSAEPDPARTAALRDAVAAVCRRLSERDRRLIELRLEGWSTAKVAQSLGLEADTLRVRLSRLRQELRESGLMAEWL